MFYLLQKDLRFQIFVLVALSGLFCYQLFALPVTFCSPDSFLPYAQSIGKWVNTYPLSARIAILFLFALQQVMLFVYFKRSKFDEQTSLLPCAALTLFTVAGGPAAVCSPIFIANTVMTALLLLIDDSGRGHQKSRVLVAGILVGAATFFDLSLFLLAAAFLFILLTNRFNSISDIFVVITGILIPYIYIAACSFFVGSLPQDFDTFTQAHLNFPLLTGTQPSIVAVISAIVGSLLLVYIFVRLKIRFDYKLIVVRKRFINIHILFFVLVGVLLLTNLPFPASACYLSLPLSLYLASYAPSRRLTITKEVVLTLFLTAAVLLEMGV
jgi:hypothetical protein